VSCRHLAWFVLSVAFLSATTGQAAARRGPHRPPLTEASLVWHIETAAGELVDGQNSDVAINPASVVKVATSLWALESLGADHRFETRFFGRGTIVPEKKLLVGDLIVQGVGDPDFQAENAFSVAAALNRLGIERVTGSVIVNRQFWIGYENGSDGRDTDPGRRATRMAARLRQALNPKRWDRAMRASWRQYCVRKALAPSSPPHVVIAGGVGVDGESDQGELLLIHRSQSLGAILRRFNCYSNNDIERVAEGLGPIESLAELTAVRCGVSREAIQIETASGLGVNRLTPRVIVRLLHEFRQTAERAGTRVEELLPVAGCDPGTVTRFFPVLSNGAFSASVAAKTGTLTSTDGGVAVLAGFARAGDKELVFCVAAPNAHGRLKNARQVEEGWLVRLLQRHGGGQPFTCAPLLTSSDVGATVILVADPAANATAALESARAAANSTAGAH
jgi:D-alanyl-D-alanine carboxypeptidase/D-alanyl-D-alanine-endopeptidase (penicillin-binding protein 4)